MDYQSNRDLKSLFNTVVAEGIRYLIFLSISVVFKFMLQRYYDGLAMALKKEFPGQLLLKGIQDPTTTGNFEVRIASTNQLIHTKSQGLCQSQGEKEAVIAKIRAHLDNTTSK